MSGIIDKLRTMTWGPATVIVVFGVCAFIAGAVVCVIIGGATYARFLSVSAQAWKFLLATGLLAVGRGVHLGLAQAGEAHARASVGSGSESAGVRPDGWEPPGAEALAEPDAPGRIATSTELARAVADEFAKRGIELELPAQRPGA